jgi:hypothetical protein
VPVEIETVGILEIFCDDGAGCQRSVKSGILFFLVMRLITPEFPEASYLAGADS